VFFAYSASPTPKKASLGNFSLCKLCAFSEIEILQVHLITIEKKMENSKIEWTDHTFNPWMGCQKVSPGCDRCYAETMMDKRFNKVEWGPHGERKRTSEQNWKAPLRWAKQARGSETRPRVFCASLADVWDNRAPAEWRSDLFHLIRATPELDWLLLTKRPENIRRMLPRAIEGLPAWPWRNVWLGTTCEDQHHYDRRWSILSAIPAQVHFISYEPALGRLQLGDGPYPDWIICGGESGAGARFMKPKWARRLLNECRELSVPFFMKQMTALKPIPNDLLVREFPQNGAGDHRSRAKDTMGSVLIRT
jgi:protein gp37